MYNSAKMLNFCVVQVIFISVFFSVPASALTMEGVVLKGKEFLRIQDTGSEYVLECQYTLKEGESASTVTWYHDEFMALLWNEHEGGKIGEGLTEGDAVLTRTDGNLEFAALKSDLAGRYRCEVMTSAAETYKSMDYQLLVVDMPETHMDAKYEVEGCQIKFSWEAPAVKPKPDIVCGVWTSINGFILTATKWMATPYYNGSVAYSLDEEIFEIFQMPLEALIRCEIKITKVDDSEILLAEKTYNFTEVWERGCPPLEVGDGVDLEYDNERITCHAEVKPKDTEAPVVAHVKCKEGFMAKYADFVTAVDMVCKGTKWDIGGDLTWNHFDNLLCVEKPVIPERPPMKKEMSVQGSSSESEEDLSSGVKGLLTPWVLILLLGVSLLSGVAWTVKSLPKKKDPRFMA